MSKNLYVFFDNANFKLFVYNPLKHYYLGTIMAKKSTVKFPIYIKKGKHTALFHKARKECNTAAPVHDVLDLLIYYYFENTFVLHRKMKKAQPLAEGSIEYKRWKLRTENVDKKKKVWIQLTKEENKRFTRKVMREGVTKSYVINLLIDFYLANEFEIETKIIRVNRK